MSVFFSYLVQFWGLPCPWPPQTRCCCPAGCCKCSAGQCQGHDCPSAIFRR